MGCGGADPGVAAEEGTIARLDDAAAAFESTPGRAASPQPAAVAAREEEEAAAADAGVDAHTAVAVAAEAVASRGDTPAALPPAVEGEVAPVLRHTAHSPFSAFWWAVPTQLLAPRHCSPLAADPSASTPPDVPASTPASASASRGCDGWPPSQARTPGIARPCNDGND